MLWSDIPLNPPARQLRQFALLWILFFSGWGAWEAIFRSHPGRSQALLAVAIVVGVPGVFRPAWMRYIFVGWMILAFPIGWTISQLMLAAMYFLMLTPLAVLFRLAGRDFLGLRKPGRQDSYWEAKRQPADVRAYFRQY